MVARMMFPRYIMIHNDTVTRIHNDTVTIIQCPPNSIVLYYQQKQNKYYFGAQWQVVRSTNCMIMNYIAVYYKCIQPTIIIKIRRNTCIKWHEEEPRDPPLVSTPAIHPSGIHPQLSSHVQGGCFSEAVIGRESL